MWTYKTFYNSSSKRAGYEDGDDDDGDERKQKVKKRLFRLTGSGFCIFMILSSAIAVASLSLFFSTTERVAAVESLCTSLAIEGIAASGNDGNIPSNTIDGNLDTRWSNHGIGSWILADLGEQNATSNTTICHVDIAWHNGTQRSNKFEISVSNDTNTYTTVYNGNSSITTTSPERYDFDDIEARYVKITVNGNNQNEWASIAEIEINAHFEKVDIGDSGDTS